MIVILLVFLVLAQCILIHFFPKPSLIKEKQYDVCIVLGCPSQDDGSISRMQKSRMDKAIQLLREQKVKILLISGAGIRNTYIEADVMRDYALSIGVSNANILVEKEAKNTYDNLRFARHMCDQYGFQNVVVVTSRFHIRRSSFFVRKFFSSYAMCPTDEKEKAKHYLSEYFRMWNTLRIEYTLKIKNKINL